MDRLESEDLGYRVEGESGHLVPPGERGESIYPVLLKGPKEKYFYMPDIGFGESDEGGQWGDKILEYWLFGGGRNEPLFSAYTSEEVPFERPAPRTEDDNGLTATQVLQKRGYLGIQYKNDFEDRGSTSYILFNPKDVRSPAAKFLNPESPDILSSREITPNKRPPIQSPNMDLYA
jgi:hypothetical protein